MESSDTKTSSQVTTKRWVTYKEVAASRGNIPNYGVTKEETVQIYGPFDEWLNGMNTEAESKGREIVVINENIHNMDEILLANQDNFFQRLIQALKDIWK